jgi:NDP-mannose synthase
MHTVILAGGKGVRLRPYTTTLPKPLVPIGERYSILEIVLCQLADHGVRSVTLSVGHLNELIRAFVGDGSRWGLHIDYVVEESPLGTIGPLLTILDRLPPHFLVMNGDVLTDLDYAALLDGHVASGAPMTIAVARREVRIDFGVLTSQAGRVVEFVEKPTLEHHVSMGVYGMSRACLAPYPAGLPMGFDELVLDLLSRGTLPHSHEFDGYWLDIGRPDDYDRANAEFDTLRSLLMREGARVP